jgi:hypothetical protein
MLLAPQQPSFALMGYSREEIREFLWQAWRRDGSIRTSPDGDKRLMLAFVLRATRWLEAELVPLWRWYVQDCPWCHGRGYTVQADDCDGEHRNPCTHERPVTPRAPQPGNKSQAPRRARVGLAF